MTTEHSISLLTPSLSLCFSFSYLKIPKISPGAYIFQRPFLRGLFWKGLSTEGNLGLKIDWASLIVGSIWAGQFSNYKPLERRAYIWRDDLAESFLRYRFGGAYIWRGLFSEFYGMILRLMDRPYAWFFCICRSESPLSNTHGVVMNIFCLISWLSRQAFRMRILANIITQVKCLDKLNGILSQTPSLLFVIIMKDKPP